MIESQTLINELLKSPIFWIFVAVFFFSIFATFIFPIIRKLISSLVNFEQAVTTRPDTTQEEKKESIKLKKQFWQVAVVVLFLLAVGLAFFIYFQSRPETIAAKNFVGREAASLSYLEEHDTFDIVLNSDLYLIDLRSTQHYEDKRIKGSFSIPIEVIRREVNLPNGKRVAVYSTQNNFDEAKEAANIINSQINAKVYLIKDGFEGLKNQGLETESGETVGGDYFSL